MIVKQAIDSGQYADRLIMADAQELLAYHGMRLSAARAMYSGDSLKEEEDLARRNDSLIGELHKRKSADTLEKLLQKDNLELANFQRWIKSGSYGKIESLNTANNIWRAQFYLFFIFGTLLITFSKVAHYIMNKEN